MMYFIVFRIEVTAENLTVQRELFIFELVLCFACSSVQSTLDLFVQKIVSIYTYM